MKCKAFENRIHQRINFNMPKEFYITRAAAIQGILSNVPVCDDYGFYVGLNEDVEKKIINDAHNLEWAAFNLEFDDEPE